VNSEGESSVGEAVPSYAEVLRVKGVLPIFVSGSLSAWGDHLCRVTIAAVVLARSGSAFAAAATFAISLLPTIFGRSLLAPIADRLPYKHVLVTAHLVRAALVGGLIAAVTTQAPLWVLLSLLFTVELAGGPVVAAGQILWTDLLTQRRQYARAFGLFTMAEQVNQAIGLAVGGALVAVLGPVRGLWFDLATFVLSAIVITVVVEVRPLRRMPAAGIVGFFRDIGEGASYLVRQRVLVALLGLSLSAVVGLTAPEAVALAYANDAGSPEVGGLLMASPIIGALVGLIIVGRWPPERQNERIIGMALIMPLPLLVTVFHPPLWLTGLLWFACGLFQAFMLPLQATFNLVTPMEMRGRVYGLAGAVAVASSGVAFLIAGYIAELTSPARSVAICSAVSLLAILAFAARWPRAALGRAVHTAYNS